MKIKSQKDFFSGLMFMGVGVAFAWGATNYNVGTGARMGPGYFPLVLGILLAVIGTVIAFKATVIETVDATRSANGPGSRWASSWPPTLPLASCWRVCPAWVFRPWA